MIHDSPREELLRHGRKSVYHIGGTGGENAGLGGGQASAGTHKALSAVVPADSYFVAKRHFAE